MVLVISAAKASVIQIHTMDHLSSCSGAGKAWTVAAITPAAAGVIAATVHAFPAPLQDDRWSIVWICITLALAALMTSTIRFYSFKDIPWTRKQPSLAVVLLA